jgi:phage terminase large subunit-like protein
MPRLKTNTESGDRALLGDLASFARDVLGYELMDWQLRVLGDQLCLFPEGHPDAGRMMFSRSLVSVARQQGKSFALKVLVLWWLVRMPMLRGTPQTVLTTAHRLDLASELFNATAPILQEKFGAKLVQSYGRQGLTMPDGTRWLVRAATPSAGMGLSCDLVVIDELYDCSTLAVDDALIPTMRARRDPLLSCWSTAGTEESHVMKRMRERGMAEIAVGTKSKMYFAEFSPPSNIDPMTPEAWKYANPALGILLEMSTLEEESHSPNTASFLRASCNLWITGHKSWLDIGLMESNGDACNLPPNGVLAIEASQEDHRFVGVRAVTKGEQVLVTVEFIVDNLRDLWASVDQVRKDNPRLTLAIGASLDLHLPSNIRGNAILVGTRELQRWTTLVRSMIQSGQVRHTGESIFIEQMNRAVLVKHNGIMAISSSRSPGPIELVRAAVWAIAQEGKPKVSKTVSFAFSE